MDDLPDSDRRPALIGAEGDGPESAAPSTRVRAIAFAAILTAGALGTFVGYRYGSVECAECTGRTALYMLIGSAMLSTGVAIVAAITMRAHTEGY